MNTLRQLADSRRLTDEQIYDVALQLCRMIPDNEFHGALLTPDSILVDEQGNVRINPPGAPAPDLSFCPPEHMGGQPMGTDQYWFSLALIIYWAKTGKSAYQLLPNAAFSYICDGLRESPFDGLRTSHASLPVEALRRFASPATSGRAAGFPLLLQYIRSHYPGTARVNYVLEGRTLHSAQISFTGDTLEIPLPGTLTLNGTNYAYAPVTISYRPGEHAYSVALRPGMAPAGSRSASGTTEKFLLYTLKGANDSELLGELNGPGAEKIYPVPLMQATAYPLVVVKSVEGRPKVHKKIRFTVQAVPSARRGLLIITIPPNSSEVVISVMNQNRTAQLIEPYKIQLL